MKFLLLNQAFYPDVVSSGQHLSELALSLVARGHEVTVLTGRRAYDDPRTLFATRETWRGVKIRRVNTTGFGKSARWRRGLDCGSFLALVWLRLPWLERHDVVVGLTSPPLISLAGVAIARAHRSRLIHWVMDLNPDAAFATGWLHRGSWSGRVLESLSQWSLRHSERIIALDSYMKRNIATKEVDEERISIVPPWSHDPVVRFDPAGRREFRRKHGLEDKFVVMYSGNHSPCHPLDTLLNAARSLARDPGITFVFVGGGSEFRKLQASLKTRAGLEPGNMLCLPYQPLDGLSASLSAADAHAVVMGEAMVGLVHPCKVYNLLHIGRPIIYIGPVPSPVANIVTETPNGACLAHGDVAGLRRHLLRLREWPFEPSISAPFASARNFSRATLLPRLVALLETPFGATRVPKPVPTQLPARNIDVPQLVHEHVRNGWHPGN